MLNQAIAGSNLNPSPHGHAMNFGNRRRSTRWSSRSSPGTSNRPATPWVTDRNPREPRLVVAPRIDDCQWWSVLTNYPDWRPVAALSVIVDECFGGHTPGLRWWGKRSQQVIRRRARSCLTCSHRLFGPLGQGSDYVGGVEEVDHGE